jgi:hypothetical protein
MSWDQIDHRWENLLAQGGAQAEGVDAMPSKRARLVLRVQEYYGVGKEEAERQVDRFAALFRRRADPQAVARGGDVVLHAHGEPFDGGEQP